MMRLARKAFLLAMMFVFAFTGTAFAVEKLKFVGNGPKTGYNSDAFDLFKFYVESRTNGEIIVEPFFGTTLCSTARECLEAMQGNAIDIFQSNFGEPANFWGSFAALDLPYVFTNDKLAEYTLTDRELLAYFRGNIQKVIPNVRLMMITNSGGWRNFATTKKPILKPEDVKGLKIRTIPAEVQKQLVSALGGAPTGISWPEVYTSLATGVVEGTKNGVTDIINANFQDHLKHLTLDGHAYMGGTWFMNEKKLRSFTPEQQQIIVDAFGAMRDYLFAYPKFNEVGAYEKFRAAGGKIYTLTDAEKEAFKKASAPVMDWFFAQNPQNKEAYDVIQGALARAQARIDAEEAADLK